MKSELSFADAINKKIAVFSTSDLHRIKDNKAVSSGKLEKAISEGYTVYVVSTRTKLSETDAWWRGLIPDERIFLASDDNILWGNRGCANSQSLITPWERLYETLGIEPKPLNSHDSENGMTQSGFATWLDAECQLENHGIRHGSSF